MIGKVVSRSQSFKRMVVARSSASSGTCTSGDSPAFVLTQNLETSAIPLHSKTSFTRQHASGLVTFAPSGVKNENS